MISLSSCSLIGVSSEFDLLIKLGLYFFVHFDWNYLPLCLKFYDKFFIMTFFTCTLVFSILLNGFIAVSWFAFSILGISVYYTIVRLGLPRNSSVDIFT